VRDEVKPVQRERNQYFSDIDDYVESSVDEYDIRGEESSSSKNDSDDEVPLANLLEPNKEKDNDENESDDDDVPLAVMKRVNANDDQDLADAIAQFDRQESLQWGKTQFVPSNTTFTGKFQKNADNKCIVFTIA